jgi:hypothetical protein
MEAQGLATMSICSPWLQKTKNNSSNEATLINFQEFFCIILEKSPFDRVGMQIDEPKHDEKLLKFIKEVLDCVDGSSEQQKAMQQLLRLIPNLKGIYKHSDPIIDYQTAFNMSLESISMEKLAENQKIISGKYLRRFINKFQVNIDVVKVDDIRKRFVTSFNRIIKNKIFDTYRQLKSQPISLDVPISEEKSTTILLDIITNEETLTGVDLIIAAELQESRDNIGKEIWKYIEEDPDNKLKNCHPREYINANCQELAIRLLLKNPPDKLTNISKDLGINHQTLNAHWKRRCLPLLQEIGKNFGYEQE